MDFKQLKELIEKINNSDIGEFEIGIGSDQRIEHIKIVRSISNKENYDQVNSNSRNHRKSQETMKYLNQDQALHEIKAPLVGIVYLQPSPEKSAFKEVGDVVKKGDTVCLIEAMKTITEVKSDFNGVVKKIMVSNEDTVEFNQPLIELTSM